MQPQSDKPVFPKISGADESPREQAARKGVFGKALFNTFIQPTIDTAAWKLKQFAPKQMAFNILNSTPLGQRMLDLKGNYEFLKNPNHDGFSDEEFTKRTAASNSTAPYAAADFKVIADMIQSSMASVVSELKSIRKTIDILHKTEQKGTQEQTETKHRVVELINFFKNIFTRDKFKDKERLVGREENLGDAKVDQVEEKAGGWLMGLLGSLFGRIRGIALRGLGNFTKHFKTGLSKIGTRLSNMFKKLKLPKLPPMPKFGELLSKMKVIGRDIGKFLGPAAKIGGNILKIIGKFSGIITVIMAAVDGIVGFFKGWADTDGPIWKKFAGGLDGAIQGIVKGLLEIPKMLLQALKFVGTSILDLLGFKSLAEQLRDFNLGEWWSKTIGGFVDKLDVFQTITTIGERVSDIFLNICEFIVKKFTGIELDLSGRANAGSGAPGTNASGSNNMQLLGRGLQALGPGGAIIGGAMGMMGGGGFAPSSGANAGAAGFANHVGNVRGGLAAAPSSGGSRGGGFEYSNKQQRVANVLLGAGFSRNVVAGFLGNFHVEAGYNGAQGDRGSASGIAQWRLERRDRFRRMFGKEPHEASMEEQAQYVVWEMQNPSAAGMGRTQREAIARRDAILNARSPQEAAALIERYYERSSGDHNQRRINAATSALNYINGRGAGQTPVRTTTQPRVDTTTSNIRQAGASPTTNSGSRSVLGNIVNNVINNQNNTVAPSRPSARNNNTTPTGPRS